MPKNTKSNSNKSSRNSSLKSTASRTSETSLPMPVSVDADGFGGLLPKLKVVQNVNKQRESPSPPPSPKTPKQEPWEEFNMTEAEFNAMLQRVEERKKVYNKECYEQYLLTEWDSPSFWERRMESLEKQREVFNTKRSWSAFDIEVVEQMDKDMKECENNLDRIFDTMDRLENQYD